MESVLVITDVAATFVKNIALIRNDGFYLMRYFPYWLIIFVRQLSLNVFFW